MWGCGHWVFGKGWWRQPNWVPQVEGYTYLGPCRCGFDPHAFWQEKTTGRVFRGFPRWPTGPVSQTRPYEELRSELECLKKEKEKIEKTIRDLEAEIERIKETNSG